MFPLIQGSSMVLLFPLLLKEGRGDSHSGVLLYHSKVLKVDLRLIFNAKYR
jgi:hypothetical protein